MNGLLVDLELGGPEPSRYKELRDVFLRKLPSKIADLHNVQVKLDYIHFSEVRTDLFDPRSIDFVLLSPQGTPWRRYGNGASEQLEFCKNLVKETISQDRIPVMGICGGHQFLALAFGGSVDFIDPELRKRSIQSYPREALAEKGPVRLETLSADPIFHGVTVHPGTFWVMENHYEEVKSIGAPFINLARSALSEIQLVTIPGKCVYGVAFHPEREFGSSQGPTPPPNSGTQILANFMVMVIGKKRNRTIL